MPGTFLLARRYIAFHRGRTVILVAAITLTIIPSIAVYIFFHERIIKGLTAGALKG